MCNPTNAFTLVTAGDNNDIQLWRPLKKLMIEDKTMLKPSFIK